MPSGSSSSSSATFDVASTEAGSSFACVSSDGQATGTRLIPGLPAGRYHLVVDADRPGLEGGVALQLSAVASP